MMKFVAIALPLALVASLASGSANAATVSYTDRGTFTAALASTFTDTFETDLGYRPPFTSYTSTAMSAVVGQTRFLSTGFADNNLLFSAGGSAQYCAGCNGSFTLFFDATTFGTASGVAGVGVDVTFNADYDALVTFGDNTTQLFALTRNTPSFFGVTSDRLVASIAFGPGGNGITQAGATAIDNLTIGSANPVPEPASWAMLIAGFGMTGAALRRRRSPMALTA